MPYSKSKFSNINLIPVKMTKKSSIAGMSAHINLQLQIVYMPERKFLHQQ